MTQEGEVRYAVVVRPEIAGAVRAALPADHEVVESPFVPEGSAFVADRHAIREVTDRPLTFPRPPEPLNLAGRLTLDVLADAPPGVLAAALREHLLAKAKADARSFRVIASTA